MPERKLVVLVSDAKASRSTDDVIVTYSLGSCIGVCLYDAGVKVGGMLHYQLPESKMDPGRAAEKPLMFADTGMKMLLDAMVAMGAVKKRMQVKIAGGASMETGPKGFDIGKRNHLAIRKILWQNGMMLDKEDVGGSCPRNVYLSIADGKVMVKSQGSERQL